MGEENGKSRNFSHSMGEGMGKEEAAARKGMGEGIGKEGRGKWEKKVVNK